MTSNYFTLAAIAREMRAALVGETFQRAYSQFANELRIVLDRSTILVTLHPIDGSLRFRREVFPAPKANLHLFFTQLEGSRLESASIAEQDRDVVLRFSNDYALTLRFYGRPNAILFQGEQLLESFRKITTEAQDVVSKPPQTALSRLGKRYEKERDYLGVDVEMLEATLLQSREAYVLGEGNILFVSLIPLHNLNVVQSFSSVNDALQFAIVEQSRSHKFGTKKSQLLRDASFTLRRHEQTLAAMQQGAESSERAEHWTNVATALLTVASDIPRGASEKALDINGKSFKVTLDPSKTAYENAAAYFERARQARQRKATLQTSIATTEQLVANAQDAVSAITNAATLSELAPYEQALRNTTPKQRHSPFRSYHVTSGMTVLVGKNAKQNDELTLHVAKPNDLWFHARGVRGSHVVLQSHGRAQVPQEAIEAAAQIAAYHSDAKTQSVAPVSYTFKKYVRKPRGADAGAVRMDREEVILVRPELPA